MSKQSRRNKSILSQIADAKRFGRVLQRTFRSHTHLYAFGILALYLLIFQWQFVTSGDSWAETYYEYVYGAVTGGWQVFFDTGIAGYYNFLPKLISYSYILLGAPVQFVDYFLRIVVILYTLLCVSFIAHPYNRHIIKNDSIRLGLALATLLIFYHISSFSIINVWYVGFIPLILVSLHPERFTHEWQQILYAAFAMSVCFTKPSLVILPLIVYRMIRHHEYLLGSIIIFSITVQTALFFASPYYEQWSGVYDQHVGLLSKIVNTLLYPGLLFLKLYQVYPLHLSIVVAGTGLLAALFIVLLKTRGVIQALLIGLTLALASYTAIYPPDTPPFSVVSGYSELYSDEMKLQREVLISFIIILSLFISGGYFYEKYRSSRYSNYAKGGIIVILILLTALSFRHIDTQSARLHVNINPYRESLAKGRAICMPIPPTPSWYPQGAAVYGWYYESYGLGTCEKTNYDKNINYESFDEKSIDSGHPIDINNKHGNIIKTVYLPVYNPRPIDSATLVLRNEKTGASYEAPIESKHTNDHLTFVAFNLDGGETVQQKYQYTLSEKGNPTSKLSVGKFNDKSLAYYSYFLPPDLKHPKDK
jgi:hypothetical protein